MVGAAQASDDRVALAVVVAVAATAVVAVPVDDPVVVFEGFAPVTVAAPLVVAA